jgi:D-glycero-alpha-D-manno-heptose-7-phosphate kinase
LRVSFLGGGSDLAEFYEQSPGAVLSVSIDKYMYIQSHKYFDDDRIRAKYSVTETVGSVDELRHPIIREALKKFDIAGGIEISSICDIPSGTGLGSSSTFTVGMLHNLYTRAGVFATKDRLAEEACDIEIKRLGEPIGKQDQYAAAFGGINVFRFEASGVVRTEPLYLPDGYSDILDRHLALFYTGRQRSASAILSEQKKGMDDQGKRKALERMVQFVASGKQLLYSGDMRGFGELIDAGWRLKKELASKISDGEIDEIYEKGLRLGAYGGKLLGAGGGGFMLFICPPDRQQELNAGLGGMKRIGIHLEAEGSKVIYVGDES